jgi:UDP:flavonoid glycosyltransferase YjiC (YdhE family)
MNRKLLFLPEACNLSETSRMIEIAKACRARFEVLFASYGGSFESLIEEEGFTPVRLLPRVDGQKADHLNKVAKGEKLGRAFTRAELAERIRNELELLRRERPCAAVTGFCVTIPVSARIHGTPMVWVTQSTWLRESVLEGGCVDSTIRWRALRALLARLSYYIIVVHARYVFLAQANRILSSYGKAPFRDLFEFWKGDLALVAEPPEFSDRRQLPEHHHFIGPLPTRLDRPVPPALARLPTDRPVVYFAMGSSARKGIVRRILRAFEGKPYTVIAPVSMYLDRTPVPENVIVTDLLPAHQVNQLADVSVIHGGIGSVMNAVLSGRPVVGVGMQFEQIANLERLVRLGMAVRVSKYFFSAAKVMRGIESLLADPGVRRRAMQLRDVFSAYDGPAAAARQLDRRFPAPCEGPGSPRR